MAEHRRYKDSVFTDLFASDEKALPKALSLCNALLGTVNFGTSYRASLAGRVLKNFVTSLFFKTSLFIVPFLTVLRNGGNQLIRKLMFAHR